MTTLNPESDRSVRQAVDAYLDGAFRLDLGHDTRFETRNGQYRLVGGVLFHVVRGAVSDVSHVGSELVGWLWESQGGSRVEMSWRHGARGILVDRRRGRHIVITSATRNLVSEKLAGSAPAPAGSTDHHQGGSVGVLNAARTMPPAGHVPGGAGGVRTGASGSGPLPQREAAVPAGWSVMSPSTPPEPMQAASPASPTFPSPRVFSPAEVRRGPAPIPPEPIAAGPAHPTVPSPHARPLPMPLPPPRRFDAAATAPTALPLQRPPMPGIAPHTTQAGRASEFGVAPTGFAPVLSAEPVLGSAPGQVPAGPGPRLEDAADDVQPTGPAATRPLPGRRPARSHVQRGMLLR